MSQSQNTPEITPDSPVWKMIRREKPRVVWAYLMFPLMLLQTVAGAVALVVAIVVLLRIKAPAEELSAA